MAQGNGAFPLRFSVEYPDEARDRATVALRLLLVIPIAIVLGTLGHDTWLGWGQSSWECSFGAGGVIMIGPLLMIVFRQKYPRWWFDFNLQLMRFEARVVSYLMLLRDEYPSTDEEQAVRLEIDYPDVENDLGSLMPLVKWFLAIPHYVVLAFLALGAVGAVIIAWFSILLTGTYPRGLFDYVVGVQRWGNRVGAYAFMLATDVYPPFSLDE